MNDTPEYLPLSTVAGYGPKLFNALDRFRFASEEEKKGLLQGWQDWMQRCPHSQNLCFADITFFSRELVSVHDALTIVMSPRVPTPAAVDARNRIEPSKSDDDCRKSVNFLLYKRAVLIEYVGAGKTMAPHAVFEAGLPHSSDFSPETRSDLAVLWEPWNRAASKMPKPMIQDGLFIEKLPGQSDGSSVLPPDFDPENYLYTSYLSTYPENISKAEFTPSLAETVSNQSINEQWRQWVDMFTTKRDAGLFHSVVGSPMGWLVALPVGNRNNEDPSDYTLVSCVFLAFDDCLLKDQVHEAIRYILLYLNDANATAWIKQQARLVGREVGLSTAMEGFGHQIKKIADKAGEGWQVTSDSWGIILNHNGTKTRRTKLESSHRIVPIPDIYRDLGKTLTLWSLSIDPEELYKPSGAIPADLGALVQVAWEYAKANLFVKYCAEKNFQSSAAHVVEALNFKSTLIQNVDSSTLALWRVESTHFLNELGKCGVDQASRQAHCELSGLLRVLVVACENHVRHGGGSTMTVTASLDPKTTRLNIVCSNNSGNGASFLTRDHIGMTGWELIQYICEEYLASLNAKVSQSPAEDDPYILTIDTDTPVWLVPKVGE